MAALLHVLVLLCVFIPCLSAQRLGIKVKENSKYFHELMVYHLQWWERHSFIQHLLCGLVTWCVSLFCDPMDCSPPGFSVHRVSQARKLELVAISFSRGSSWPRDQSQVSHMVGRFFTLWATREAPACYASSIRLSDMVIQRWEPVLPSRSSWSWMQGTGKMG